MKAPDVEGQLLLLLLLSDERWLCKQRRRFALAFFASASAFAWPWM
jgi:hypothetical protein